MLEKLRILVVEDIASIRSLIVRLLERLGCTQVYEAADIATARGHLDRLDFDVILLDYELENENGLSLVRRLRADHGSINRDVPVIVLTGHKNPNVILSAVQAGANSYLVKPVMPDRLGQRILDVAATNSTPRPVEEETAEKPAGTPDARADPKIDAEADAETGGDAPQPADPDVLWLDD